MGNRGDISQGKLASGLLGVGLASGLVALSLGVVGPATASCISFGGIAIGEGAATHCVASFGSIAIVLGPTPAGALGSKAFAGNTMFSPFNFAISVGGTETKPTITSAGLVPLPLPGGLPQIGNVSFATAGSQATSAGILNLADSFGGTGSTTAALGLGNSSLNLGSDNHLTSAGVVNNTTNAFGDGNSLTAFSPPGTGLIPPLGLNVAFNTFGNNNQAVAGPGPGAIAGLIGVNNQKGADAVTNSDFGIELRTPFNVTPPTSTSLAGGNVFRPATFAAGSGNRAGSQLSGSLATAGKQFSSSLNSLSKTFSDAVKNVTGGLAGGTSSDK